MFLDQIGKSKMNNIIMIRNLKITQFLLLTWMVCSYSCGKKAPRFEDFPKIDAHVHIETADPAVIEFAKKENFKFITLCTGADNQEFIDGQLHPAQAQKTHFPKDFAYTTTFSMEGFDQPGWLEGVIKRLGEDFDQGAIGIKVYKDIGMTFRDSLGNFIMIDDQRFDPIFEYIEKQGKIVVGHLGEPKNCWLPIDSMTVKGDRAYYSTNPQYHMYKHPEYPSYDEQIAARDRRLAKNPNLKFIGAHLGSLEWSVDELAKRLDKYPNFAVDMAARVCHLQIQDSKKVRDFILKYQDRLMYATDFTITNDDNYQDVITEIKEEWHSDWDYFSTDNVMGNSRNDDKFKGLALDETVLGKIYYKNVFHWFPGIFE
ncbi:amidohydrolase family protein [Maribacter polysiphoniae]|uniref:Amidohydrolase family protein n=2 Tax=Maribacter polysiphoniae TaxID=429344 RepID=A0A316E189_9FLAO|nr:amidohydrolase family protein [Maribacter polysiphoniae]